jgi:imidazolonepropionase-like amidohydrolase
MRPTLAALVFVGLAVLAPDGRSGAPTGSEGVPAPENGGALALVGATIRTQTDAGDFVGTVVIAGGKVVAVGPDVPVPGGARRIDLRGHVITPGLIDARSTLGLNPAAAKEGGRDADLNILDAVDPFAEDWRDAARQGVTAVYVQPASSGSLGGGGAVLRVGPAATAGEMAIKVPAAVQASLGAAAPAPAQNDDLTQRLQQFGIPVNAPAAPTAPARGNALTRFAQYEQLRGQLDNAKKYGESKPTRKEPAKELLLRTFKGEIALRVELSHDDDFKNALHLPRDLHARTIFEGLEHLRVLPDEAAADRSGFVLGPFLTSEHRSEARTAALRKLVLDGRRWAIGTHGSEPGATAWLRAHAAAAVAEGYPRDAVLRALTRGAAELFGVADRLGSIAAGRTADLAVFAGDPLDPSVPTRLVISQGEVVYEADRTTPPTAVSPPAKPNLPATLPASYVLKTTRLLTPFGEYAPGTLVVHDGKLAPPGSVTSQTPVFDLGDAPVTPGLVAAHVIHGGEDTGEPDAAQLRGRDGLAPDAREQRDYLDAGFLTVVFAPGSGNVLAGLAEACRADGKSAATVGQKFVLSGVARGTERFPSSLAAQVGYVDERLSGEGARTEYYLPPAVQQALIDQRNAALVPVRDRKQVAVFEAQTRTEVRAALRLAAGHNLRGVLLGPQQIDELTEDLKKSGVAVVAAPAKPSDADSVRRGLVEAGRAGVPLAFGTGGAAELRATAAWLVNAGLPRAAARRGLIGAAAPALGLAADTGRLAPGASADFVVWDGDPLDLASTPVAVVLDGQRHVRVDTDDDGPAVKSAGPAPTRQPTRRRGRDSD